MRQGCSGSGCVVSKFIILVTGHALRWVSKQENCFHCVDAGAPGDLATFTPYPVLSVVNFGKTCVLSNRSKQRLAGVPKPRSGRSFGRWGRAKLHFAAILDADRWTEHHLPCLTPALQEAPSVACWEARRTIRVARR